ncbi:zinc finger 391-like isoform X1, partial [Paramuricea clavata]
MAKNTPTKVYGAHNLESSSCCRLCIKSVGDPAHRYKLFNKTNSEILAIAEHIYGHPLPKEAGLPQLICRPCERRLRSFSAFKNTIVQTQSTLTKFKRCNKDSPGVSRVSKSLKSAQEPPQKQSQRARQRLCFMQSSHGKE